MKIVCPECSTAYDVTPASLGSGGRQVRCARCQAIWYADLPKPAADIETPAAADDRKEPSFETPSGDPPSPANAAAAEPSDFGAAPDWPQPAASDAEMPPPTESGAAGGASPEAPMAATAVDDGRGPVPAEATPRIEAEDRPKAKSKTLASVAAASPDIESPAARPRKARHVKGPPWHTRGLTAAIVVLAVVDTAVIMGRANIVQALPQTASLFETIGLGVNLRGLAFKDVTTKQEKHEGATILLVEGTIVATGRKATDVPRLRFAISAGNGHEIYAWTALPTRTKLAPGEALPFRTRLASPPDQGRSIKIRFFNRRDIGAGLS